MLPMGPTERNPMFTPNDPAWLPPRGVSRDGGVMVAKSQVAAQTRTRLTRTLFRVLLVDDDPALLDALSSTIEFHLGPLLLHACYSPVDALDRVQGTRYD